MSWRIFAHILKDTECHPARIHMQFNYVMICKWTKTQLSLWSWNGRLVGLIWSDPSVIGRWNVKPIRLLMEAYFGYEFQFFTELFTINCSHSSSWQWYTPNISLERQKWMRKSGNIFQINESELQGTIFTKISYKTNKKSQKRISNNCQMKVP